MTKASAATGMPPPRIGAQPPAQRKNAGRRGLQPWRLATCPSVSVISNFAPSLGAHRFARWTATHLSCEATHLVTIRCPAEARASAGPTEAMGDLPGKKAALALWADLLTDQDLWSPHSSNKCGRLCHLETEP